MTDIIKTFEFTSHKKFNITVRVYKNRIEIDYTKSNTLFIKGLTGICTIYLKHLTSIEFFPNFYMEFLCPGYVHVDSTLAKVGADNSIFFTKKENDKAIELYSLINSLIN